MTVQYIFEEPVYRDDYTVDEWWEYKSNTRIWLRTVLSEQQNYRCCWCGIDMDGKTKSRIPTIEHIVPKCDGGTDDIENLAAACYGCNNARGSIEIEVFMEYVALANEIGMQPSTFMKTKHRIGWPAYYKFEEYKQKKQDAFYKGLGFKFDKCA